ncbi:MAG: hypothetical protein JNG89_14285 [Planctomycetaceae bacterium]|nr:hypothetical protein [Planctomycetaceae bacterium]
MLQLRIPAAAMLLAVVVAGCSSQSTSQPTATATAEQPASREPSPEGTKYRLAAEPAGAQEVTAVRTDAADGDKVVVVGRIGGDVNPWVDGRAAFSLVDNSVRACSDIPGDACPTPWDYCCETDKLKTGKMLVKFVDDGGQLIASDARELLGVGELDTVIIEGTVQKSEDGNAVLLASGLFVKSQFTGASAEAGHEGHDHDGHDHGHEGHEHGDHDHDEAAPAATDAGQT